MIYKRIIDPALMRFGDVLTVTSGAEISAAIRAGIAIHNLESPAKVIRSLLQKERASHTLVVTDPEKLLGREMNWPEDREVDLSPYIEGRATILSCIRNPWYTPEHNPETNEVYLARAKTFINEFHSQYSLHNIFAFLTRTKQEHKKLVCSQYTLLMWIVSTICEGVKNYFPQDWIISGDDNAPWPGLVNPDDINHYGNLWGWAIQFSRYEEKK